MAVKSGSRETMGGMESGARVCPFCGEAPGIGVFCVACGRNLAAVEQLPTREEWEAETAVDPRPLAERCAEATAAFLTAMHAAGDPGASPMPVPSRSTLRRAPKVNGWVVRPVDRDDESSPRRYEPGLFLSTDGHFHRLDSELRGFGQRDFPVYHHTIGLDPIDMPADERLIEELAAVLREHDVAGAAGRR
jgi:hypothetical protein